MSKTIRLLSWNVNGLRAVLKKGFLEWVQKERPDVLAIQEVRADADQLPPEVTRLPGYRTHFSMGERKGYSGVGIFTTLETHRIDRGIGIERFDNEGRFLIADFGEFTLYDIYFPNGGTSRERLDYKLEFYDAFLDHLKPLLAAGKRVVICGDVNTAHTNIDLARPKENAHHTGFLPEERDWIDRLLAAGFHDTFRMFNGEGGNYTYWDFKTFARKRNVGWRIDYFFVSDNLKAHVKDAFIMSDVEGSDHCPTGLILELP